MGTETEVVGQKHGVEPLLGIENHQYFMGKKSDKIPKTTEIPGLGGIAYELDNIPQDVDTQES